jgi:polysaccharide export outer membrane protein
MKERDMDFQWSTFKFLREIQELVKKVAIKPNLRKFLHLCLANILVFSLANCAGSPNRTDIAPLTKPIALTEPREKDYFLQLGDVIEIKLFYYSELNETITIRPDGRISLQLVGEVQAVGLTPSELTKALKQRYTDYLEKPEVVVLVKEFATERIYIGGEVKTPSEMPFRGRLSVMQAIFKAGGLTDQAKPSDVLILRYEDTKLKVFRLNVDEILEKGGSDPLLKPYDIVYVPKTFIAKVDLFVNQYINDIIPRSVNFPFLYMLNRADPANITVIGR